MTTTNKTVRISKLFTGGALAGLTYTETMPAELAARFPVGTEVAHPVGGSPYRIVAVIGAPVTCLEEYSKDRS
jgi:hypothetical protein